MNTARRLAVLTLFVVGCSPSEPTAPAELSPPADRTGIEAAVPFDPMAVQKEFRTDEKAARAKWDGKWVTCTLMVSSVNDGNVVLEYKTGEFGTPVDYLNCLYPRTTADRKSTSDALATRGGADKPITVTGRLHYEGWANGVHLRDSVFTVPKP